MKLMKLIIKGEYSENYEYFRCSLKALNCLLFGSLEATVTSKGMGNKIVFDLFSLNFF